MGDTVLVTGANGHVGFNLCKALVERGGARVRASVRSLTDESKTAPLRALGDVELVALDVQREDQFDAALEGVDVLHHVAATYATFTRNAEEEEAMVRDSVEGARLAVRAAARAGVRKVVLTSSIVTLPTRQPGEPPATEEEWRTDLAFPYFRAKTLGEKEAWRLAEELGVHLVTILPGGVGGPVIPRRTPTIDLLEGIMLGTLRFGAPSGNFTYVDVRDVARGHLLAAEKDVSGRFILNQAAPTFAELGRMMHAIDPEVPAPPFTLPAAFAPMMPLFDWMTSKTLGTARTVTAKGADSTKSLYAPSSERARKVLGWEPARSLEESLADSMTAIRAMRRAEGKRKMS